MFPISKDLNMELLGLIFMILSLGVSSLAQDMSDMRHHENTSVTRSTGPEKAEEHSHKHIVRNGESMGAMPMIQPKRIYTVTGKEDFDSMMGFGKHDGMVGMMNLMMVEGSGMEGMEMEPMTMAINAEDPLDPKSLAQDKTDDKMEGMNHSGHVATGKSEESGKLNLKAETSPNPPKTGDNLISFSTDGNSKQITNLKVQVEMTSMDMGTEEPKVVDLGGGKYQVAVKFSMSGPWHVRIEGMRDGKKVTGDLNFDVGSKTK